MALQPHFFHAEFRVHGLDSYPPSPEGDIVNRFANGGCGAGRKVVRFGANMSGVIVAMRRTLLSCTSLARDGLIALVPTAFGAVAEARAGDLAILDSIDAFLDMNHQEFAVLTTALALLGFSVVAAILLMRTRLRAAKSEARLRADIAELQIQTDRYQRAAVRRTAGADLVGGRRQQAGNRRRHLAADAAGRPAASAAADSGVRNLAAAGAGAADGPCGRCLARGRRGLPAQSHHLERTHRRSHGPRDRRPGHGADSRTRRGAPGTRRNPACATRRCWKRPNCCATSPPPPPGRSGPRRGKGSCASPTPPTRRRPKPTASRTRSTATSNCSTATTATTMAARAQR